MNKRIAHQQIFIQNSAFKQKKNLQTTEKRFETFVAVFVAVGKLPLQQIISENKILNNHIQMLIRIFFSSFSHSYYRLLSHFQIKICCDTLTQRHCHWKCFLCARTFKHSIVNRHLLIYLPLAVSKLENFRCGCLAALFSRSSLFPFTAKLPNANNHKLASLLEMS